MPKVLLTDLVATTAKPIPGKQVSLWDTRLKNFGLRINPKGTKTWQVMIGEKRQRITIGHYPEMTLKDARTLALSILADGEQRHRKPTAQQPCRAAEVVGSYIQLGHAQSRPRYAKEEERLLRRHLISRYADLPLDQFTPAHILAITDDLATLPSEQFHAHRAIKAFFKWAAQRQLIGSSPVATLPHPGAISERDRLLSDSEVARIYTAAVNMGHPFGYIVLICIHTGLRRGEVGSLRWSCITPEYITIPKEIAKNGREHRLPNLIGTELGLIPRSTSSYLFPTSVGTPFCAWGKNKKRLDALCGIENFVLHDFRRYLSSTMRRLGVPIDVTETILNHVSGSRSQIQRIYDRHDRMPEMREALFLYEKHLAAIVSP